MGTALQILRVSLGLALIFFGAGFLIWRAQQVRLGTPPVDMPLPSLAHEITVATFTVPQDGEYLVAITAERAIPTNTLDCLLGINDALLDNCSGIPTAVNADWTLSTGGKPVAHGSSRTERQAGWSARVYKGIGRFSARQGQPYRLEMQFLSDTSPLNSTEPHIEVWRLPSVATEYRDSLLYALAKPVGIAFVILGALLLTFGVARSFRRLPVRGPG